MNVGDFTQHAISRRYGFVIGRLNSSAVLVLRLFRGTAEPVLWSHERILPAGRKPTAKEWARFCAYRLTEGA